VSTLLYGRLPNEDEGKLSRVRSHLVRQDCLAKVGERLNLSSLLKMGEGEHRNGGCQRPSILADAVEALIGAILLDSDFATAERVVVQLIEPVLAEVSFDDLGKDAKTRLQELLQAVRLSLPNYQVTVEGGTAHQPVFTVRCDVTELGLVADGSASSRKSAEQIAAEQILSYIEAAGGIKAVKQQKKH
jgi:ribonuclease-3